MSAPMDHIAKSRAQLERFQANLYSLRTTPFPNVLDYFSARAITTPFTLPPWTYNLAWCREQARMILRLRDAVYPSRVIPESEVLNLPEMFQFHGRWNDPTLPIALVSAQRVKQAVSRGMVVETTEMLPG
ncbi:MAG: hypothetical protein Q9164_001455 [Protoblastenia rupestris]